MDFSETGTKVERAILVSLVTKKQTYNQTLEYLEELDFLARTAGIETVHRFMQRLDHPETRTYVGKGKLAEIKTAIKAEAINVVIFDDDLSPSQLRNIERELEIKIYDRSLLILDIFLLRAQTAQAQTQVELARFQYLLPRLTNMWTHLERQRGGTGTRGGSGEKEIETDKRTIRDQISLLKERLAKIDLQSQTRRKSREGIVRVAIVGYTNVGKSTIMNLITKAEILAENKLFATVDSTVRKVVWDLTPFLLTDTVGFIRKLPHTLVACFKSTLDEVREADILLHVVDVSHPTFEDHIRVVENTLGEIGCADKPVIMVLNKIDVFQNDELNEPKLDDTPLLEGEIAEEKESKIAYLRRTYMNKSDKPTVFISATEKENINEFREIVIEEVKKIHKTIFNPSSTFHDYM